MRNSYRQSRRWNIHQRSWPLVFLFFLLHCPICGGQLFEDFFFFLPLWLDLNLSDGLSKVTPFIFFTITAMRPPRFISQPNFFNDSSLLKTLWLYWGWARPYFPLDFSLIWLGETLQGRSRQNLCIYMEDRRCEIAWKSQKRRQRGVDCPNQWMSIVMVKCGHFGWLSLYLIFFMWCQHRLEE